MARQRPHDVGPGEQRQRVIGFVHAAIIPQRVGPGIGKDTFADVNLNRRYPRALEVCHTALTSARETAQLEGRSRRDDRGAAQGRSRDEIREVRDHGDWIGQAVSRAAAGRESHRLPAPYKLRFGGLTPRSHISQTLGARAPARMNALGRVLVPVSAPIARGTLGPDGRRAANSR